MSENYDNSKAGIFAKKGKKSQWKFLWYNTTCNKPTELTLLLFVKRNITSDVRAKNWQPIHSLQFHYLQSLNKR